MMNGIHTVLLMLCPPALGLIIQEMAWRFFIGHCPSCVYPPPDVSTCDQISQAFPLCICMLQAIKCWRWVCPGNEANWYTQDKTGWKLEILRSYHE